MRKLFLLISVLTLSIAVNATKPTITIDGDKSDWSEIPMLSEPGTWPMLKVIPATDAEIGTNALAFLLENSEAFTSDWSKYPGTYIDKDYNLETNPYNSGWIYKGMGIDYAFTTGASINDKWVDFPKGKSEDYKAIEIGVPNTYLTDLGSKFGIGMYYGTGGSQEIWIPKMSGDEISSPAMGYFYKTRSYTTMPGTVTAANAYAHQSIKECTDYVDFGLRDNGYDTIRWAAFPIELTTQGVYDVTANVTSTNGWKFEFWLVDVATNAVVAHIDAPASNISESKTSYNFGIMDLSRVPSGKYMLKVKNRTAFSKVKLNSVTLSYVGGEVQDISTSSNTTLNVADAWFSGCTRDNDKTYIQYPSSSTSDAWIKWNIATSETKYYDLTVNVNTTYAHGFTIAMYEDEEAEPVASVTEGSYVNTQGVLVLELGRVNLVGGKNYVVKVTNAPSGSQAKVTSVVFAPVVATATELPNTLAFSNAVLSEKAFIQDDMLYFNEIGDSNPQGQWAQWEVTTDHNGLFLFTMGVTSTNEQTYKITIKDDGDNEIDFYETSPGSGTKTLTHYFALSAGNYFVKVENTRSYSAGHLTSFVVTEPAGIVTIDENATSTDSWISKYNDGNSYDVQINRTIVAGMYNTICLPFEVTPTQAKDIFGADVQLRTLKSATLEEEGQVLNLSFTKTSGMHPGTPHLIKTSRDIINPVFVGVQFTVNAPATSTGTNANFKGNFIAGTIPVSENNLFLGANNKLFFPTVEMPILGMRAYFIVHDASSNAILRARIVEGGQVATEIDLVSQEPIANSQKLIINGQLIIIRDGVRYNVMGTKIQ